MDVNRIFEQDMVLWSFALMPSQKNRPPPPSSSSKVSSTYSILGASQEFSNVLDSGPFLKSFEESQRASIYVG